jgi:hypothetical protein
MGLGMGMCSVMVISQIPGASVVDCLSLCRRNAAALPRWARVVMYGQSCGGECLGDGVGGLGRGGHCGAAWMTALGLEGDIGMRLLQDA